MDLFEGNNHSSDFLVDKFDNESSPYGDLERISSKAEVGNPDHHSIIPSESPTPNLLDSDHEFSEQFGEQRNIPEEVPSHEHSVSPSEDKNDGFDFEKKLPETPEDEHREDPETQMTFSTTHFQDDGPSYEDQNVQHDINQDYPEQDIEQEQEEEEKEKEEIEEPLVEVNNWKPQEKFPEPSSETPKKDEVSTPPSHRSPSPVLVKEPENESLSKSFDSPAEKPISTPPSSSHSEQTSRQTQPNTPVEPIKTRSVRSTKSEGRNFLGRWFDLTRLNAHVVDLVYWRDPRKSGIVLGAVLTILLSLSIVSVVSVISYSALAVLTGTLSFRLYKSVLQAVQKTQDGHPFKEFLEKDVTVTSEKVHEVADVASAKLNSTLLELRRLFLVEDFVDSIKFGLVLWALTYVGSWFNGLTLVILGVIGLFSVPKVYETHQEKIDQNLDVVRGKINEIVDKVQAVLPIGKKAKSQ